MTAELLVPAPAYVIAGVGPYPMPHPYQAAAHIIASVRRGDEVADLTQGVDFTVAPASTLTDAGDVTLSADAAATYDGWTLTILRATPAEQGWQGVAGPREKGLERQLDWTTHALQDVRALADRALVLPVGSTFRRQLTPPGPGRVPIVAPDGMRFIEGPSAAEIAGAQDAANRAEAAAAAIQTLSWGYDTFIGDGVQTVFVLSDVPASLGAMDVSVGGETMVPGAEFGLASSTVTFAAAPGSGERVLVRYLRLGQGVAGPAAGPIISVKAFAAVGDGSTIDQVCAETAVAWCAARGETLYWPAGTYLIPANIPDFWSIRHAGPGVIQRGATLFPITPVGPVVAALYVDPAGSDANDGLSAAQPIASIQIAVSRLRGHVAGRPDGQYRLQLAGAAFAPTATISLAGFPFTARRIQIRGEDVSAGGPSAVPSTVIDASGFVGDVFRNLNDGVNRFDFRDIKFVSGSGWAGQLHGIVDVECWNLHGDGMAGGMMQTRDGHLRPRRGVVENCGMGYYIHSGSGVVGAGAGTSGSGDRITFSNCGRGVLVGRASSAYVVDNHFALSTLCHVQIAYDARARTQNNAFTAIANGASASIIAEQLAAWTYDPANLDTWTGIGPNKPPLLTRGLATAEAHRGFWQASHRSCHNIYNGAPLTFSSTSRVLLADTTVLLRPFSLPAFHMMCRGARLICEIDFELAANTTFTLELAGDSSSANAVVAAITSGASAAFARDGKLTLEANGPRDSDDRLWGAGSVTMEGGGGNAAYTLGQLYSNTYLTDASAAAMIWRLYLTLAGASPGFTIRGMRSYVEH